jgi:hypothetical protein
VARFSKNSAMRPTIKLNSDPINGPPVCLPNLVFKIAWKGSNAPMINVRNMSKYFIRENFIG